MYALRIAAAVALSSLGLACDRDAATPETVDVAPQSVMALMLAVDDALRAKSVERLAALAVDAARIDADCASMPPAERQQLVGEYEQAAADIEAALHHCVALADWPSVKRGFRRRPLSTGLNVDTRVCGESWRGCSEISRMCKSEMFYFVPDDPGSGYKVSLSGIGRIEDDYVLLGPPRCVAKGNNAR